MAMRLGPDEGMSLIELTVAMVVFAVVGGVISTAMISTLRTSRNVQIRGEDLNAVQIGMDEMTKLLRSAAVLPGSPAGSTAIVSATSTDLVFYTYNRPGSWPSKAHLYYDSTSKKLIEDVYYGTGCTYSAYSYPASPTRSRTLATSLSPSVTLFTYRSAPVAVANQTAFEGPAIAAPVASASLDTIEQVQINLSVDLPASPDLPSANASTVVFLPNQLVAYDNLPDAAC